MTELIRSDGIILFEIIESLGKIQKQEELDNVLVSLEKLLYFDTCIFTGFKFAAGELVTNSVMKNYPEEWHLHYLKSEYHKVDPVAHAIIQSPGAIHKWSDLYSESTPKIFLDESRDFNLHNGLCLSWNSGGYQSLISFSTKQPIIDQRTNMILMTLIPHFHEAMNRVNRPKNPLTEKERETLRLISKGHTNQEVSLLSGVSYDAILNRIKRIKNKLKARNIQHAVYLACTNHYL